MQGGIRLRWVTLHFTDQLITFTVSGRRRSSTTSTAGYFYQHGADIGGLDTSVCSYPVLPFCRLKRFGYPECFSLSEILDAIALRIAILASLGRKLNESV